MSNFNSRTSCEVRQSPQILQKARAYFNSRTSCEVRQGRCADRIHHNRNFNSRTSCEVRRDFRRNSRKDKISTHAPRVRCDWSDVCRLDPVRNFNSRTSCEVRHVADFVVIDAADFNSRTSCEVRRFLSKSTKHTTNFNSRTSCEVRPERRSAAAVTERFQLTHLV